MRKCQNFWCWETFDSSAISRFDYQLNWRFAVNGLATFIPSIEGKSLRGEKSFGKSITCGVANEKNWISSYRDSVIKAHLFHIKTFYQWLLNWKLLSKSRNVSWKENSFESKIFPTKINFIALSTYYDLESSLESSTYYVKSFFNLKSLPCWHDETHGWLFETAVNCN